MTDGQHGQVVDAAGRQRGEPPGQGGAPVVADHVGPGDAEVGQDRRDVCGQQRQRVGLDVPGFTGPPVTAEIGDHDLEPGPGQLRHLIPPDPAGVGEPVQQQNRRPVPGDLVLGNHPVDLDPAHRRLPTSKERLTGAASGLPTRRPYRSGR